MGTTQSPQEMHAQVLLKAAAAKVCRTASGPEDSPGSALVSGRDIGCTWQKNEIHQTLSVNISGKIHALMVAE